MVIDRSTVVQISTEQLDHVFATHAAARRHELGSLSWLAVASLYYRDLKIAAMQQVIDELQAQLGGHARAMDLMKAANDRLYQQAQSTPRTINSVHVRKSLIDLELALRSVSS